MHGTGAASSPLPSCSAWLPVLRRHLHGLVGEPQLARLGRAWEAWTPACLTAIEVRLVGEARQVDTAVRLSSPGEAQGVAAAIRSPRIRGFAARWGSGREVGHPKPVPSIWLELDLPAAPAPAVAPLLCARLESPVGSGWLTGTLLPALVGGPLSASRQRLVERVVHRLPPEASVLYAFDLAPRSEGVLRLELFGLGIPKMLAYLRKVAPAAVADRVGTWAHLAAGADRYHLSLDLAEEVLPRVGIECGWRRPPRVEPGWSRILERLVRAGLCAPARGSAVLAWPGVDSLRTAPERWPDQAVASGGFLVRALSHVKVAAGPGGAPEAKAYLLFQHRTGSREGARSAGGPCAAETGGAQDAASAGAPRPSSPANALARPA